MEDTPTNFTLLRNNYWVLRHGRSIPNERGLIVSSLENGTREEFGLAAMGIEQARLAGELFKKELEEKNFSIDKVRICYSPFTRTIETAREVARVLGISLDSSSCKEMVEFRERYFGTLELLSHDKYTEVWALDEKDPSMPPGGESVADVASRLAVALLNIETAFQGLNCGPTQGISSLACPAAKCGDMYLGNTSSNSACDSTLCSYAGYTNRTSFTILTNLTTLPVCNNVASPVSQPKASSALRLRLGLSSWLNLLFLFMLACSAFIGN